MGWRGGIDKVKTVAFLQQLAALAWALEPKKKKEVTRLKLEP